jgi:outer membrane protein assembly factor BamB
MKTTVLRNFGMLLTLLAPVLSLEAEEEHRTGLANFDKRREAVGDGISPTAEQTAAAKTLKERSPGARIDWDEVFGSPRFILNERAFLSGSDGAEDHLIPDARPDPLAGDPHKPIKRFLNENSVLFGFDAGILTSARLSREFSTAHNALRTVVWEQQLDGIPVFEGVLYGHIGRNGELVSLCSQFLPALAQAADAGVPNRQFVQSFPPISAQQAVAYAATNIGERLDAAEVTAKDPMPQGAEQRQRFEAKPLQTEATASLVWLPMNRQAMRLCWRVVLTGKTRGEMFQVLVDAETGEPQVRHCWTFYANPVAYRVFPSDSPSPFSPGWSTPNTNQPSVTSRVLTNLVAISTNASPDGWITPGRTNTIGNNVDAHLDWNENNPLYGGTVNPPRPTGTTNNGVLTFDFSLDLSQSPTNVYNSTSAVVNAFYWANWMHDKLYDLGFTESAGNYQQTNFGRGGLGEDAVLVDVQDSGVSLSHTNNANGTAPPQDGIAGRLQFYLFTRPAPDRDPDFDAEWLLHEYTHLMSMRLVGHGTGISGLQSIGLGEGWSDFLALALLAESGDATNGNYAWGAWPDYLVTSGTSTPTNLLENYYYGGRSYPYTTQMSKNPLTLGDARELRWHPGIPLSPNIKSQFEQDPTFFRDTHRLGEIWCTALWEARAIYISKYGFSNGTDRILRVVVDGMKLGPANPTFLQARDAILLADRVTTGGVDQTNLWTAFAKRGMGWSAICPGSYTTDGMIETFDLPPPDRKLWAFITGNEVYSSPAVGPDGTIYVGSKDSKLYAINPDGTLRWTVSGTYSFDCSPAVGPDGTVYMGANDGYLRAVTNGVNKWANYVGGAVFSSPAIGADGTIYVGVAHYASNIVAFSPAGTRLWATTLGTLQYVYSSPAIGSNGTVYIGCMDGKIYALNPTNGQVITSYTTGDGIYSSPAIGSDGSVYVGSLDGKVYAFDAGLNLKSSPWPFNIGTNIYCSPAISADGTIYIGADNWRLYALNPDGSQRWSLLTGNKVRSTPAIGADGSIYFGSYDWRLFCVATNGTTNWTYYTGFNIFSSPVIGANATLYVGSADSKLYALPANTYMAPGAWPCFRRNLRHTGNVGTLWLQPSYPLLPDFLGYLYSFQVYRPAGQSCQIEQSEDLVTWVDATTDPAQQSAWTATYQVPHSGVGFYRVSSGALRSLNAIGSVVLTSPPSPTQILIANPFNTPDNTVRGVLSNVPEGTRLNKWDEVSQSYRTNLFSLGRWSDESMTLKPGEGVFFSNPLTEPITLHLTGEILQGDLSNSVPAGVSVRSSMVSQPGLIQTTLGYSREPGDVVMLYTNGNYLTYTVDQFEPYQWLPDEPALAVGEAAHFQSGSAKAWHRRYVVWP